MKTNGKWHYLYSDLWPFCHADELFQLGLPQVLIAKEPLNYCFVQNVEQKRRLGLAQQSFLPFHPDFYPGPYFLGSKLEPI
jgi:hypothetical protein